MLIFRVSLFFLISLVIPVSLFAKTPFIVPTGFSHETNNSIETIRGQGQVPILLDKSVLPASFEKIQLIDSNYSGLVYFIWQPKGQTLDPNTHNIGLQMQNGIVVLPENIQAANMEKIGIIIPVDSISFRDILVGKLLFSDKWTRLTGTHNTLLPSTINLIYPKYWGNTPLSKIIGTIVLVLVAFFFFYNKKYILTILLCGWILWDIFYIVDQGTIVNTTIKNFVIPEMKDKVYFDLGDTYGFAKMVENQHAEKVDYFAPRNWPFFLNFSYHAYPTQTIWEGTGSNLVAISGVPWNLSGSSLSVKNIPLSGEYTLVEKFSESSYIFKRK